MLDLLCHTQAFYSYRRQGYSLGVVHGLLIAVASPLAEYGPQSSGVMDSGVVALGVSCPAACGIFLDDGSNLCPLHWQVDS